MCSGSSPGDVADAVVVADNSVSYDIDDPMAWTSSSDTSECSGTAGAVKSRY